MLRSCPDAPARSASESTGCSRRTVASTARSLLRVAAPMRRPPVLGGSDAVEAEAVDVDQHVGLLDPELMRSTRLVPPPRNRAAMIGTVEQRESLADVGRTLVAERLHRAWLPTSAIARTRCALRAAPTEVAAHPLLHLGVVEVRDGLAVAERCDRARPPGGHLVEHAHRRAELPGRAVPALERVVLEERPLQRVGPVGADEPFDRAYVVAAVCNRQREAAVDSAVPRPARCSSRTARGRTPSSRQ